MHALSRLHAEGFAAAMARLVSDTDARHAMGRAARAHTAAHFSRAAFGSALESHLRGLLLLMRQGGQAAGNKEALGKEDEEKRTKMKQR